MISQFLHQLNYTIKVASDIQQAYMIYKFSKIDLIILDFFIKNLNGFLLIYKIAAEFNQIPPFIITSIINNYKVIRNTYKLGALAYLNKSKISLRQLSILVADSLRYTEIKKNNPLPNFFLQKLDTEIFNFSKSKNLKFTIKNNSHNLEEMKNTKSELNLSNLGFNIEEIENGLKWPNYNSNKLSFSFYFLDKNISILNLKGMFERSYISEIIDMMIKVFKKENKHYKRFKMQLIIDFSNIVVHGIEEKYIKKLISDIIYNFSIINFIYITGEKNITYILSGLNMHIPFLIKKNTLEGLSFLVSRKTSSIYK